MRLSIIAIILISLAACAEPSKAQNTLPNQLAIAEENQSGTRVMQDWSLVNPTAVEMTERQTPDNPAFAGAELWRIGLPSAEPDLAAVTAFSLAGMVNPKLIAQTALNHDAIDVLDSHPDAKGHAVMVSGFIRGEPAHGIAISLYGSTDESNRRTGVHAFMAPEEKFEALGGFSIVVAKWFHASASPGEDMKIEGSLPPQAATNRMAIFFNRWVEAYVIPIMGMTMQMQMQSIQQMSSWNNAMNACNGDPSCTVTQDGFGNWSANQR
jgi:hypothetical protein